MQPSAQASLFEVAGDNLIERRELSGAGFLPIEPAKRRLRAVNAATKLLGGFSSMKPAGIPPGGFA